MYVMYGLFLIMYVLYDKYGNFMYFSPHFLLPNLIILHIFHNNCALAKIIQRVLL
jgi:hypothetical protein